MAASREAGRPKEASFVKIRFVIAALATLCPVVCYISRQNLSMAIVAMVEPAAAGPGGPGEPASFGPRYKWQPGETSLVFQAFFLTYVACQIPAARLAEIWGAKWILATAAIGSALVSLASPWAARQHVLVFAAARALMGLCQTALYPACYVLYTRWLPPAERSQALPVLCVGAYVGSIVASTSTGYFSEHPRFGWPFAFYAPSAACALWACAWLWLGASEPRHHRLVSLEELDYIEARLEQRPAHQARRRSPSWRKLLTSAHIWTMACAFFASNWSFTIVLLLLPTYLNSVLLVPPFRNGLINSLIYVLFCLASPLVGAVSTLMVETRACNLSRLATRKLFQAVALFSQTACFVALPLVGRDTSLALAVLYAQIVLYSFVNGGEVQLPSDLSVDFAGTIYAIGNCVGSSTGFIVPLVHSLIVSEPTNERQWHLYFYLAAAVCALGGLIFVLFGQNDLQDFAEEQPAGVSQLEICQETGQDNSVFTMETREQRDERNSRAHKQIKI